MAENRPQNKMIKIIIASLFLVLILIMIISFVIYIQRDKENNELINKTPSINNREDKKVEIIVFGDYQCPFCKMYERKVFPKINKDYLETNKASYHFVNAQLLGKESEQASRASYAVYQTDKRKYWEFHKKLFDEQENKKGLTMNRIDSLIESLGLPADKVKKVKLDYKSTNSQSFKASEEAKEIKDNFNVKQVPTVIINGKKVKNPYKYNEIKKVIEKEADKNG
ncbi:DsbA family protein [Staphylococcus aureus]|uniref:DsbA family protein n=1 Tax=Staphylococcus aureus TaxID=1280 RepID=UPI0021475819|nr:DsbA family protein [Staphylococcus aureus]MCQ9977007.1 DsbA family protein [Staphylococcus aureus]